jgi:hypothetical protein
MARKRRLGISLVFSMGLLATACAAGRVAATFDIQYETDATFTVAPVLLWAVPEVTCVLLVFFMPSLPKVFAEQSHLTKALRSVRSWTRLQTPRTSEHKEPMPPWPPTIGRIPGRREPRPVDEYDQAMNLTDMQASRTDMRISGERPLQHEKPQNDSELYPNSTSSITRTTEVEQRKAVTSDTVDSQITERQHPWIRDQA